MRSLLLLLLLAVSIPAVAHADDGNERTALSIDPVGLVTGSYAASLTQVVGPHAGIRADVQYTKALYPGVPGSEAWSASVGVPIYLDRPLHGPFVELGAAVRRIPALAVGPATDSTPGDIYTIGTRAWGVEGFVGWQWTFRSGLHLSYAIGAAKSWCSACSQPLVIPENEIRAGVAF